MKGRAATAAAAIALSTPQQLTTAAEYLEPNVQRIAGVLPPSVCKQLIDLGEESGFIVEEETIDEDEQSDPSLKYVPAQMLDVYEKGSEPGTVGDEEVIEDEAIWNVLRPWIPKITAIVKEHRNSHAFGEFYPHEPGREPDLNWVFFRKYSPDEARNSLKHHHDTNMNTVTIAVNDDYVGGGLFYIKPLASTGEISREIEDSGYDWIDAVRRENTSEIVFPDLRAGDAIFYNYTVEHGVAPLESGTRYSMAFFFDMDNPDVKEDFSSDDDSEGEVENEFQVELHNELTVEIDIVLVYKVDGRDEVRKRVFNNVLPNERTIYYSYDGDLLRALRAGTQDAVADIEIKRDQSTYTISKMDDSMSSEL